MKQETINRVRTALKTYKFRSSSAGSVVSASGKLIQTAMSYGNKLLMELIHQYREEIHSSAMEKGTACEPDARALIYRVFFPGQYIPDSQRMVESAFFRGHIDMEPGGTVIDAKNAENARTFLNAALSYDNEWQMKSYLQATGTKKGYVIYCLNDLPEELLNRKINLAYKYGGFETLSDPEFIKKRDNIIRQETYPEYEDHDRVKVFEVTLSDEDERKMNLCAHLLRTYMQEAFEEIVHQSNANKVRNL